MLQGLQAKQHKYVTDQEWKLAGRGLRMQAHVECNTCKQAKTMNTETGVMSFLMNHEGHATWVNNVRSNGRL